MNYNSCPGSSQTITELLHVKSNKISQACEPGHSQDRTDVRTLRQSVKANIHWTLDFPCCSQSPVVQPHYSTFNDNQSVFPFPQACRTYGFHSAGGNEWTFQHLVKAPQADGSRGIITHQAIVTACSSETQQMVKEGELVPGVSLSPAHAFQLR